MCVDARCAVRGGSIASRPFMVMIVLCQMRVGVWAWEQEPTKLYEPGVFQLVHG